MPNSVLSSAVKVNEAQPHMNNESSQQPVKEIFHNGQSIRVIRPEKSIISSLIQQAGAIIPRYNIFKKQLSDLEDQLSLSFIDEEIDLHHLFDIIVDFDGNYIKIESDREDRSVIEKILNGNVEIRKMIQKVFAVGSHIINIADSVAFRDEYSKSEYPEKVVLKYSELFDDYRRMKEFSLRYDNGLKVLCDRAIWSFPLKSY